MNIFLDRQQDTSLFIVEFFVSQGVVSSAVLIYNSVKNLYFELLSGGIMPNQLLSDSAVNDILEKDIIVLLGLEKLPKEKQDEYRQKAIETILDRVFVRITNTLDEMGKLADYEKVVNDEERAMIFLADNGLDLEQILIEETMYYKTQMKTVVDLLDAGINVKVKSAQE